MTALDPRSLLDPPPFAETGYAALADRVARLIGSANDVVFVEAEAVVALEAVATSLSRPQLRALNVVSSPYGALFGGWLKRGGAFVHDLVAPAAAPISVAAVRTALERMGSVDVLSVVHAESASGVLNPLEEIAALAHARGTLFVVDAVASVGGHPLGVDALGIDVVAIGPQKALGGPAGLSAVAVSDRAWRLIDRADAPRHSVLSLADRRRDWLDAGRGAPSGTPVPLEWHALAAALDRVEAEGLDNVIARHARAAAATRRAVRALGLGSWPETGAASNLVTAARLPDGLDRERLVAPLAGLGIDAAAGPGTERLIRLNHTGPRATPVVVRGMVKALGAALVAAGHVCDAEAAGAAASF